MEEFADIVSTTPSTSKSNSCKGSLKELYHSLLVQGMFQFMLLSNTFFNLIVDTFWWLHVKSLENYLVVILSLFFLDDHFHYQTRTRALENYIEWPVLVQFCFTYAFCISLSSFLSHFAKCFASTVSSYRMSMNF